MATKPRLRHMLVVDGADRTILSGAIADMRLCNNNGFISGPNNGRGYFSMEYSSIEKAMEEAQKYHMMGNSVSIIKWLTTYEDRLSYQQIVQKYEYELVIGFSDRYMNGNLISLLSCSGLEHEKARKLVESAKYFRDRPVLSKFTE